MEISKCFTIKPHAFQLDPRALSLDHRPWTEDNDLTKSGNGFNQNLISSKSGFLIRRYNIFLYAHIPARTFFV